MHDDGPSRRANPRWLPIAFAVVGTALVVGAVAYRAGMRAAAHARSIAPRTGERTASAFAPPDEAAIPGGPEGAAIRRGRAIFTQTGLHAARYVGNGLVCSNCHLDAGRKSGAAPMWAAWGAYPAYRAKNHRINTMEDRIHDCFLYSMNAPASPSGAPPPLGDDLYRDLESYFAWLAKGLPSGSAVAGRGYPKLSPPRSAYAPSRGAAVFAEHCSACHGAHGGGQIADAAYAVPPLWGSRSFNWGAGMATVASAAPFIKQNMPLGQERTLTDQQAWDVAAFIDSHERPRDPRQTGSVAAAQREFHSAGDYYGQISGGHTLGTGTR